MSGLSVELRDLCKTFDASRGPGYEVAAVRHVNLGIHSGEFFTLLGPSGCGKTTTLRIIAGFETPTEGEVMIEGQPTLRVPPHRRPVNIVFQNYALFPHLTVEQNVAFGPSIKGTPRDERERRVREALTLVRLPNVGDRKPAQLSGGQQQRVALARALVNDPKVLLLDEPLGALDLKLRKQMQIELKHIQQQVGITFIYVTHDQEEALTMSDRIAVMNEGEVLQVGDPVSIYERPSCRFVADFIGETNFLRAHVVGVEQERVRLDVGGEQVWAGCGHQVLNQGQDVTLAIRPEKIDLWPLAHANGASLTGVVRETVYIGTDTRFLVALGTGETVVARLQNIGEHGLGEFHTGDHVKLTWSAEDARPLTG